MDEASFYQWKKYAGVRTGQKLVADLSLDRHILQEVTNGAEFCNRALDAWAYQRGVKSRASTGSCAMMLNTEIFFTLEDVRQKLEHG